MAITLTADPANARVQIAVTGLAAANTVLIERSTDQLNWRTVRRAAAAPVAAGVMTGTLYDYEYAPGVVNHYRARGVETGGIGVGAIGAAAAADNAPVVPGLPAGLVDGDLMLMLASIRNVAATVNVPAGWTALAVNANMSIVGRRYVTGDVAPTVTFTGGAAGDTTLAIIRRITRAALGAWQSAVMTNASAQNIAYSAINPTRDNLLFIHAGWKQDDWTSVETIPGHTELSEQPSTLGNDAGQVWDYLVQTTATPIAAGSFTVTGGAAAVSASIVLAIAHAEYLNEQTASITPAHAAIWLKSPLRPFLNRPVTVVGFSDVARDARGAALAVVGRSLAVAVADLRGGKAFELELYTADAEAAQTLDYALASGDVLYLQVPQGCAVPGGYFSVGATAARRVHARGVSRVFTLLCVEVAAPDAALGGAEGTWTSVLAAYGSWSAVLAAFPTWTDLLALVGDPSEVIVP